MFLCPHCLRPAIAGQTINEVESTGQVVYRMRYCKWCSLRIKTKEEIVETTYYIRRESKKDAEEDND